MSEIKETAAAILALPDDAIAVFGKKHPHFEVIGQTLDLEGINLPVKKLKALAESWQQQNAMLEAAIYIEFEHHAFYCDSGKVRIFHKGETNQSFEPRSKTMPDNDDLLQRAAAEFAKNYISHLSNPITRQAAMMADFARAERKRVYDEAEQTINSFIEKLRADGTKNAKP